MSDSKGDCGLGGGSRCLDALADTTYSSTFHADIFFSSFLPRRFSSCFSPHFVSTAYVLVKMSRRAVHSPLFLPIFSLSRGSQNHSNISSTAVDDAGDCTCSPIGRHGTQRCRMYFVCNDL